MRPSGCTTLVRFSSGADGTLISTSSPG